MPTFRTYSKRRKALPDVFDYSSMPKKLRVQIVHIWNNYLRQRQCFSEQLVETTQKKIYNIICEEEGVHSLYKEPVLLPGSSLGWKLQKYFEELPDSGIPNVEKALDVIEVYFFHLESLERTVRRRGINVSYNIEQAIKDLNYRFRENGVGYEYSNGQIIRVDNKILHQEVVQNTLELLQDFEYKNVNVEFLKAHEHYRHRRIEESLNESLKAFETTLKIVIHKNGWDYEENFTARKLIKVLFDNNFFPLYHESQLNALKQFLESSIPTIRNKNSGHGKGTQSFVVPDYLASYMLYITGATIKLIIDTQETKNST